MPQVGEVTREVVPEAAAAGPYPEAGRPRRTLERVSSPLARRLWGAHLLGVVCVCVAATLGWWQLESWQAVRAAEARDLSRAEPVPVAEVLGPDDPFPGDQVGRPVEVSGIWVPEATVYVAGRAHEGADGHWVVTPVAVGESGSATAPALPVVRGWVADPADAPAAPSGAVALVGFLQPGEGTGEMDTDPNDDVLPQLRIGDLVQHVDQDLYGGYVIARDGLDGLPPADVSALPQVSASTGLRNLLYALEWAVFGSFAAYVWWRFVRDATAESPARPAEVGAGAGAE